LSSADQHLTFWPNVDIDITFGSFANDHSTPRNPLFGFAALGFAFRPSRGCRSPELTNIETGRDRQFGGADGDA